MTNLNNFLFLKIGFSSERCGLVQFDQLLFTQRKNVLWKTCLICKPFLK